MKLIHCTTPGRLRKIQENGRVCGSIVDKFDVRNGIPLHCLRLWAQVLEDFQNPCCACFGPEQVVIEPVYLSKISQKWRIAKAPKDFVKPDRHNPMKSFISFILIREHDPSK